MWASRWKFVQRATSVKCLGMLCVEKKRWFVHHKLTKTQADVVKGTLTRKNNRKEWSGIMLRGQFNSLSGHDLVATDRMYCLPVKLCFHFLFGSKTRIASLPQSCAKKVQQNQMTPLFSRRTFLARSRSFPLKFTLMSLELLSILSTRNTSTSKFKGLPGRIAIVEGKGIKWSLVLNTLGPRPKSQLVLEQATYGLMLQTQTNECVQYFAFTTALLELQWLHESWESNPYKGDVYI